MSPSRQLRDDLLLAAQLSERARWLYLRGGVEPRREYPHGATSHTPRQNLSLARRRAAASP